jgi:futalosine hydrolase
MRILIVAATKLEVVPVLSRMYSTPTGQAGVDSYTHGAHDVDVVITGVGMVATAVWSSHALARREYDLALNLGVCGAFDAALELGTVVHVVSDRLSELGAEDGQELLTLEELELPGQSAFMNAAPPSYPPFDTLPAVTGITVNTVHGTNASIAAAAKRFNPQVESMEGAAFMSACLLHNVTFGQVRAISNRVERRDKEAWKMADAIRNLGVTALRILDHA